MPLREIEVVGNALALHPPVVIGVLLLFQYIKRRRFYADKEAAATVKL